MTNFSLLISDVLSPSHFYTKPRPPHNKPSSDYKSSSKITNRNLLKPVRTRRTSDSSYLSSSQFFSAANFSSFLDNMDLSNEPVREISDEELTRLGFPIPTLSPSVTHKTPSVSQQNPDFHIVDSPFFQIISRKYLK